MSGTRTIYLSGPITGLSYEEAKLGWREELRATLEALPLEVNIILLSPMRKKEYLEGSAKLSGEDGNWRAVMSRDFSDIDRADLVVINLNNSCRVSIGTMVEIGYAKKAGKPMLLIMDAQEINAHDHGWVYNVVDAWVDDMAGAIDFIVNFCSEGL